MGRRKISFFDIIIVLLIVILVLYNLDYIKIPQKTGNSHKASLVDSGQLEALPIQPLPLNGEVQKYQQYQGIAPFKVNVPPSGTHYLMKIRNWETNEPLLAVFVHSGESIDILIPLGEYRVQYAAGQTWYGHEHLFGPGTSYFAFDKKMEFTQSGNRYLGHGINMAPKTRGNLPQSEIMGFEF